MKIFKKSHDGGKDSGVTGYWLIECKSLFSVVLLRFSHGSRDAFHSHAFHALTWWLHGSVIETIFDKETNQVSSKKRWYPSFIPKLTKRNCFHRIDSYGVSWALSIRGRWSKNWEEHKNGETYKLAHGRKRV